MVKRKTAQSSGKLIQMLINIKPEEDARAMHVICFGYQRWMAEGGFGLKAIFYFAEHAENIKNILNAFNVA